MDVHTLEELARRVARLEAQNLRLKQTGVALVCVVGVLGMIGFNAARRMDEVEATRFVVRDASGETRASLSLRDGQPALALFDDRGREQVILRSTPEHASSLEFFQGGHLRMFLESAGTGASQVQMLDARHQPVTGLYTWPDGKAGLAINHGLGGARLSVDGAGTSRLGFASADGVDRGGWMLARGGQVEFSEPVLSAGRRPSMAPVPVRAAGYAGEVIDALGGSAVRGNAAMAP
jgi:hypothetical protein